MGRLSRELTDPWGFLVAGVAGGVAVAASMPIAVGLGVGAAVYGVKVAIGALTDHNDAPEPSKPPLRPRYGSFAATWLKRAEDAGRQLDTLTRQNGTTATDLATLHAAEQARAVLGDMRRLAGQSAAVARALETADAPGLDDEAAAFRAAAQRSPDDASAQQSARALQDRIDVRERLRSAGSALDGRLQASALGLEGLVARVAELSATAAAVGEVDPSAADLESLTTELDGMRLALADVEAAAQKALRSVA